MGIKVSRYMIFAYLLLLPLVVNAGKVLVIGKVTVTERQKSYAELKPMVEYVAGQLSEYGIEKGEVYFANNNQEMTYALLTGKVDWVTDSIFSALIISEKSGAKIDLKRVKAEGSDYRSLILVKNESKITGITDLVGKTIAFEDVGSSSAYYMPYIELVKYGITPEIKNNNGSLNSVNGVKYIFSGSEFGLMGDLMSDKVDAIAYSDQDYEELLPNIKNRVKIIHGSVSYPKGLELFSSNIDKKIQFKIIDILMKMHEDPEGISVLNKYFNTEKFEIYNENNSIKNAKKIIKSGLVPLR